MDFARGPASGAPWTIGAAVLAAGMLVGCAAPAADAQPAAVCGPLEAAKRTEVLR
jgi:hypothetical protein